MILLCRAHCRNLGRFNEDALWQLHFSFNMVETLNCTALSILWVLTWKVLPIFFFIAIAYCALMRKSGFRISCFNFLWSWIIQLKTLTRFLLQLLISWFLGQTVKIQVTSYRNIWIWRSKELFRLNLWFVHKLRAALFSTWKMSKMIWVFKLIYTSILFPYLKAKNSTPTPWLTQIRFTRVSLTQLFKRFPFLT